MFRIINFYKILKWTSISTTTISIVVYIFFLKWVSADLSILKAISISSFVVFLLIYMIKSPKISRFIWNRLRLINKNMYPDLNGSWKGHIRTNEETINIDARIVQSLIRMDLTITTPSTTSIALETTPVREDRKNKIYHVYRSIPNNKRWAPFIGTTIFNVITSEDSNNKCEHHFILKGTYFTDRKTEGEIYLYRYDARDNKASESCYFCEYFNADRK